MGCQNFNSDTFNSPFLPLKSEGLNQVALNVLRATLALNVLRATVKKMFWGF